MALRRLITRNSRIRALKGLQTAVISGEIMQIHHQKYHQSYVTNYNKPLENLDTALAKGDAPAVVKLQSTLKFNGGGHINHSILWQNRAPVRYLCRRSKVAGNISSRNFSSSSLSKDTRSIEEEAERKVGWVLKLIFAGTATLVGYQVFPYMGDNLMQQSVSLLQVKDPLFKRMGASRLSRFARDDERRMKIMEVGGAEHLLNMLGDAKEDRTRKEALKALVAISPSDEAVGYLHRAGAISVIRSIPDSSLADVEVEKYKLSLMKRFEDLNYDG